MEISPEGFFAFKEENKIKINICGVIEELFHELIGHGRHELNSRSFPPTLQDNSINTWLTTTHIHAEGVSQITKNDSINFMKKYKEKYSIEDDYIQQREYSHTANKALSFLIFYQYLQLKKLENRNLDIEKEFLELTNNYGLFILYSTSQESPLSCIKNSTYPVGLYYMNSLLENLRKELGPEKFQKNHSLINQAISTGVWHFVVLQKFVKLFLKTNSK